MLLVGGGGRREFIPLVVAFPTLPCGVTQVSACPKENLFPRWLDGPRPAPRYTFAVGAGERVYTRCIRTFFSRKARFLFMCVQLLSCIFSDMCPSGRHSLKRTDQPKASLGCTVTNCLFVVVRSVSRVYPSTWKEAPSSEFVCATRRIRLLYLSVLMRHHAWHNIDAYVSWLYHFIGRGRRGAFCVILFLWDLLSLFY